MAGESFLSTQTTRSEPAAWRAVAIGALWVGPALYCLAVWNDWLPWLRGWRTAPEGWTWVAFSAPLLSILPVLCAISAIWAVTVLTEFVRLVPLWTRGTRAFKGAFVVLFLATMIVLGYAFQLSLLGLKNPNPNQLLVEHVTDRVFTGYFGLAASTADINIFFSKYPEVFSDKFCSRCCPNCHYHPPGPALFYWLSIQAAGSLPQEAQRDLANIVWNFLGQSPGIAKVRYTLSDAQILGAFVGGSLVLLLASAVVAPLFGLARLLGPRGMEFRLAALGLALPGLMLMAPQFDQIYAAIYAGALYFALRGLAAPGELNAGLWAAAAGLMIALGLYFSWAFTAAFLSLVVLGFICIVGSRNLMLVRSRDRPEITVSQFVAWGFGLVAGVVAPLALLALVTRIDLFYIFDYTLGNAQLTEAARPYFVWLFFGPLDFLQFLGLPLMAATLLLMVIRPSARRVVPTRAMILARRAFTPASARPENPPAPWYARINAYAWVFWFTLISIALAGNSKAEQGRTLIFLMPLALAAVYFWAGKKRPGPGALSQLFFAQMAICVVTGARWYVP